MITDKLRWIALGMALANGKLCDRIVKLSPHSWDRGSQLRLWFCLGEGREAVTTWLKLFGIETQEGQTAAEALLAAVEARDEKEKQMALADEIGRKAVSLSPGEFSAWFADKASEYSPPIGQATAADGRETLSARPTGQTEQPTGVAVPA